MSEQEAMRRYRAVRDDVSERLRRLERLLASQELPPWFGRSEDRERLQAARVRLEDARFVVAVVGEFSSGKSFLLNALLGKVSLERDAGGPPRVRGLLATDVNPSTATITELEYGPEESATAVYANGRRERVPLDRLARFVAVGHDAGDLHDATAQSDDAPTHVRVRVDSPFLAQGFVVADTPGLASVNPAHRRATLAYLPGADAVLYVIDTQQPFTEGDAAFLGIVRSHIDSLFIVQTKLDLWRALGEDGEETWHAAYRRIAALAATHAPRTPVYPVSAREYAEGTLTGDDDLTAQSRFGAFIAALDRSLVASAGRNRLRRAWSGANAAGSRALRQIDLDAAALRRSDEELRAERAALAPQVDAAERAAQERGREIAEQAAAADERIAALGVVMADDLERSLATALDAADVHRLRDRAKLHLLVDGAVARIAGVFARTVAGELCATLETLARAQPAAEPDAAVGDLLARCFGHEPGTGAWAGEAAHAAAGSIVLRAVGGPSVSFVHAVATRFASGGTGRYMKRELLQDLRAELFPSLRGDVAAFAQEIAGITRRAWEELAQAVARETARRRDERLGTLDRIAGEHPSAQRRAKRLAELVSLRGELAAQLHAIEQAAESLRVEPDHLPFDARNYREAMAREEERTPFDADAYGLGLRPERWRVVVLGAFRRGKSSLINAVGGRRILGDDTASEAAAFPIHVRFGPVERASALESDGTWREVPLDGALDCAARMPLLVEVPWSMPKQLVLVHAPAFDTGDERAEEICLAAAASASEVLCLFSRQLSERELTTYRRVAEMGKPLLFVHTMADNETPGDRRKVADLAGRYLRERNIAAGRIFTISTREHQQARREGRAPAGWNELDALITTLESHAEAHMQRLERAQREQERLGTLTAGAPSSPQAQRAGGLTAVIRGFFKHR